MGEYLLRIVAAGIICCIVRLLIGKDGAIGKAVKLLSGIFMTLIVIAPMLDINIDAVVDDFGQLKMDGMYAAQAGDDSSMNAIKEIIIDKTQAYILDKAKTLGAEITVNLELTDEMLPIPCGVTITGNVSPYAKKILSEYMQTEFGICKEAQFWIG